MSVNMAVPLSLQVKSKALAFRQFLSPLVLTRQCKQAVNVHNNIGYKLSASLYTNGGNNAQGTVTTTTSGSCFNFRRVEESVFTSKYLFASPLFGGLKTALPCCLIPLRHYGRKVKPKPQKIATFDYSGDLRKLPELNKDQLVYKYRGLESEIKGNEVLTKLTSLEFASNKDNAEHRKELVKDRILSLFGPDSELELRIALQTLCIRKLIPHCLKYRTDKLKKIWLVSSINSRRKLLNKLREIDHERLEWLLQELKIRYVIPKDRVPFKGWKYNLRIETQNEAVNKQRKKLEDLKAKFEAEKKVFFERKQKMLTEIEEDLKKFGLNWESLNDEASDKQDVAKHGKQA